MSVFFLFPTIPAQRSRRSWIVERPSSGALGRRPARRAAPSRPSRPFVVTTYCSYWIARLNVYQRAGRTPGSLEWLTVTSSQPSQPQLLSRSSMFLIGSLLPAAVQVPSLDSRISVAYFHRTDSDWHTSSVLQSPSIAQRPAGRCRGGRAPSAPSPAPVLELQHLPLTT